MSYYQPETAQSGYYGQRTQFPDILSAPAPVLRDDEILIDDETVCWDDTPRSSSYARPSPVQTSYVTAPSPSTTSPAMSSVTMSPASVSTPHAASSFARPPSAKAPQQQTPSSNYDPYHSPRENNNYHDSVNHHTTHFANSTPTTHSSYSSTFYRQESPTTSPHNNYSQSAFVLHQPRDRNMIPTRPPQVERMRSRRKVATAAAGVLGGLTGLVVLGPIGAIAGGVGGAMLTKQAGKRLERKQTERIAAARYATEEARYGRSVPALQTESAQLT